MSSGRGRGYGGRHREPRPGATEDDHHAARLLVDLNPRANDTKSEREREERSEEAAKPEYHMSSDDETTLKELLTIDEQYTPLLVLLEQFSPGEDGIQFNRKLRHFESTVTAMCPDEARLQQAFAAFRAAALLRTATARRLAAVGACFTRQQRQQPLRAALLNVVMQGTFSKLDLLERANPAFLINAANLMGDYFAEARLCNGNKVHILAAPLLQYMRALLACDELRAHRSLATQLMQNGRELLSVLSQELDDLSISIRLRLLTPPSVSIIWLLLSADLCLNKFLPLPNTLQQFYAAHLELTTDDSYNEVNYGSWKQNPDKAVNNAETDGLNISQISLNHDEDGKPKLRPILGAGAGLLRQEQALTVGQDSFDTWTSKNEFASQKEFKNEYPKTGVSLSKRYDLNSWRQADDEKEEEPVFNPAVLPPNLQFNTNIPEFTPQRYKNYDNLPNYLQQGDSTYIQSQYPNAAALTGHGDFVPNSQYTEQGDFEEKYPDQSQKFPDQSQKFPDQSQKFPDQSQKYPEHQKFPDQSQKFPDQSQKFPDQSQKFPEPQIQEFQQFDRSEKVNCEVQKSGRRPVENWRVEKADGKEDANRNRPKNWTRQRSKESLYDEDDSDPDKFKPRLSREARPGNRVNRRNSSENSENSGRVANTGSGNAKVAPRRTVNVTEVPRNHKYWDHDDRCDKDYNS